MFQPQQKNFNLFSFFKVENIIYIPIYRYCCKQRHLYIYISITYIVIMEGESLFGGGGGRIKPSGREVVLVANDYGATVESLCPTFTPDRKALRNLSC